MLYAEDRYGEFLYGDSTKAAEEELEVRYWVDLSKYVPAFVAELVEMAAIYDAQGYEIGRALKAVEGIFLANFVKAAPDWALLRWEQLLGMKASDDDTADQRRSNILAKLKSAQVCTPEVVKTVAEEITGVDCIVEEDNPHYWFTIKFIGKYGYVRSVAEVKRQIDEIKPAHLGYDIQFKWCIWRDLQQTMLWDDVRKYTWGGLLIMEIQLSVTWGGLYDTEFLWRQLRSHTWKNIQDIEEAKA